MPGPDPALLQTLSADITAAAQNRDGLLVVGICGAQGSGKSTLCDALAQRLGREGLATAVLSLDDLYRTRAERLALARDVHPLFATRGVPGTHDVQLGLDTIAALEAGGRVPLPRFDKGLDDRHPPRDWPLSAPGTKVLLFEGWCVGAVPQPEADLAVPVNALEREDDAAGTWRRQANAALAGPYRRLFGRVDRLILLAAPDWNAVAGWREQQEAPLRAAGAPRAMDRAALDRFLQHYERLTRWILAEMPARANRTVRLGPEREVLAIA